MTQPISVPVVPPQPNQLAYSIAEMALFKTYTRDSYRAAFGVEAPIWDPSRLRKSWFDSTVDSSDPSSVALYKLIATDVAHGWGIKQLVLPSQEAATVNLPGAVVYAEYAVTGTGATRGGSPINADYLSLESEARALSTTIGGDGIVDEGATAVFPVSYPPDEPRRMWAVLYHGKPVNAGMLFLDENSHGVGAPGHWDFSLGVPVWSPAPAAPTGLDDARPARDIPVRDLLPNEKLQMGLMGVSVMRTDIAEQQAELSGVFTPDDRATLQQIYQIISRKL